jgi:hypothetical protein
MKGTGFAAGTVAVLASVVVLSGQSGRSYGPAHTRWDAGLGGYLAWEEDYDNPTGQITILNRTGLIHAQDHPFFPLFRITCRNMASPHPVLGRVIYTQDPGRALISGKCADAGSIVMPQFRGLAARAPYFSNGSAKSLRDVVEFCDKSFGIRYTEQEKKDLVNFLSVL